MKVQVQNQQKAIQISKEIKNFIKKAVSLCLVKENLSFDAEVAITLVDNKSIGQLNKEHRQIDQPTDVLSFPSIEYINGEPQLEPGDLNIETNLVFLGDIIISAEKAYEQAQNYGHSMEREFSFLAVHGSLHLLGYDHETEEDEKTMFSIQEEILDEMGLLRA